MKKTCPGCGVERNVEQDFKWKYKSRGIRQRWCKFCQAEANKVHYQNNKQIYLKRALSRNTRVIIENQQHILTYLYEHPCTDCGCTDIRCLEFDHVHGKKLASISEMLNHSISWPAIKAEIAKCEVRCANCHRMKTSERGKWWRFALLE